MGGFSFQRPACDIFVVGITQFPSTFYMMVVLYSFGNHHNTSASTTTSSSSSNNGDRHSHPTTSTSTTTTTTAATATSTTSNANNTTGVITLSNRLKYMACCGFILNAPLLPLYPILVQYTHWSLGTINTLLHTWLLVAWTCQGMSLRQIGLQIWMEQQQEEEEADPSLPPLSEHSKSTSVLPVLPVQHSSTQIVVNSST
jgi:hypothetical protein